MDKLLKEATLTAISAGLGALTLRSKVRSLEEIDWGEMGEKILNVGKKVVGTAGNVIGKGMDYAGEKLSGTDTILGAGKKFLGKTIETAKDKFEDLSTPGKVVAGAGAGLVGTKLVKSAMDKGKEINQRLTGAYSSLRGGRE